MSRTQHYILFDSSCSLCSDLAADIEKASGGALLGKSLYSREAKAWLDRARPGWKFEPTLVTVHEDEAHAYTGMAMRAQMLTFLNPLQLLRIARIVQKAGVPLFGSFEAREPSTAGVPAESDQARSPAQAEKLEMPLGFRLTSDGPEVGARTPVETVTTNTGRIIHLDGDSGQNTLLLFLSTSCTFCRQVASYLHDLAETAPEQLVLVFSTVEPDALRRFVIEHRLGSIPVVISPETRAAFNVTGIPYAFALDGNGQVRGKGIVNNADHLDSLANTFYISVDAFKQALASRKEDKVEII